VTKNTKTIAIMGIVAIVGLVIVFVVRDLWLRQRVVRCPDGSHPVIDARDFRTDYWAYSVRLQATVEGKGSASVDIDPKLVAQVSEALREANEFRKYVVDGYNSCAITSAQYAQLGERFRTLDSLAREINALMSRSSLSTQEQENLADLISKYSDLVRKREAK
jgi:hypothetical protein